jgi:2-amino-4-hydroxy-6-hydroxymethyldihydropteridine diphosphokinase
MSELHRAFLCLGSNIEPEVNLRKAVVLLKSRGQLTAVSEAWESRAVGAEGPNFLNACALFLTDLPASSLIENVIRPIEAALGRRRTTDRFAARPIDIDIVLYDNQPLRLDYWEQAFMLLPLAELLPDYLHPLSAEPLQNVAARMRETVWIVPRPDALLGV